MLKSQKQIITQWTLFLGIVFLFCSLLTIQAENADDTKSKIETPQSETYWIGVQVVPVPEIFLSHFGVNDESEGLIVVDSVIPDGPANTAGVKRGDIFLKFGDKEIHSLSDLVEQIANVKGTATTLEMIRNGTKSTLTVTPVPRPNSSGISNRQEAVRIPALGRDLPLNVFPDNRHPQLMLRQMEDFFRQMQADNDFGDMFFQPSIPQGVLQQQVNTGKQLSVAVQTQNGKTTIKVTQVLKDGDNTEKKTWEVESVDELPEDIRGEVKMLLGQ